MSVVNTPRPRNDRHFQNDIFQCIFLKENVWISIKISLKSAAANRQFNSENGLAPFMRQASIWNNDGKFTDA